MVKDGTTIVIGGLRKDKRTKTVKKIPLIGDMPGLGFLFRSTDDKLEKTDLVILLTPHIMSGEKSYTDFAEIKPQEGAVLSMEAGNIIVDKISASKQDEALNSFQDLSFQDYQQLLINRINQSAKMSSPAKSFTTSKISKSGEVEVDFRVSADGSLISEPVVINTTDPNLIALAIKAVKDASPFPPLPQGLNKKEESFRISPDTFRFNRESVFSSR
jgi:TonB family protein